MVPIKRTTTTIKLKSQQKREWHLTSVTFQLTHYNNTFLDLERHIYVNSVEILQQFDETYMTRYIYDLLTPIYLPLYS